MGRIRQARRRTGLSQEELAKASGVSPATVAQVELGHRQPQGRTLRKIANALGVEVAELVEEEETSPKDEAPTSPGPHSEEGTGQQRRASLPDFKDFLQREAGSFYLALPHELIKQLWEQADTPRTRMSLYEQIRREHAAVVKLADEKRDQLSEVQRIKLEDIWMRQANTRMLEATERVRHKTQT